MSAQVLVVEDEKLVAADIQSHLEKLGYGVPGILSTGEDAINSASQSRPDLVLMDIHLKGRIDGIDAARILQSRLNIPVIYVTAFADDRTLQRAKETVPYGYIIKPFGQKELQTAIELALHKFVRERRLRTNEQWLMGLIANIGAAVMAIDHNGLVCLMNPQAEQCTGSSLTDALGTNWSDLISFLDSQPGAAQCPIRKAVDENLVTEMSDAAVLFLKTGRKAILCGAVSPMLEPGADGRAAILAFRDITEWQQLETYYRRARHLAEMQQLAGGLAHQFANYLTLISGCSESLAYSLEQTDARLRDVRAIQKVTECAGNLTRQLLTFSHGQPISLKVFDLSRVVGTLAETLQHTLGSGVTIEQALQPPIGKVEADPAHLEQILTALVSNARDAMLQDPVITIRVSNLDVDQRMAAKFVDLPPGPYVRIDVADRGAGMSYEKQSRIFEPFFSTKDPARGIGLAAVYGLVKQNRGHIWFESEPHKGTTFSVCLPRVDDALVRSLGVPRTLRGVETILIAEDDAGARETARDVLLDLGYRVLEAASGSEALKICEQEREQIHLLLSNVITPNMTAGELMRRLPLVRPGVKLLFMSAYSAFALQRRRAIDQGLPILQRPFTSAALAKAIRDVLDAGSQEPGAKVRAAQNRALNSHTS